MRKTIDEVGIPSSMFDFRGFYTRMANELPNDCKIAEVGVADGASALYLCYELHRLGKTFKMYMIDGLQYGGYEQLKSIYQNIIATGFGNEIEVVPYSSLDATDKFNDGYFDFVFLDSSHTYPETKWEILKWYPKVKDECVLAGHDYNSPEVNLSVNEVVPTFFTRQPINDQRFKPQKVLHIEDTDKGYGIFWLRKQWYLTLNQ